MLAKLKLVGYGVLLPLLFWCAWGFYTNYNAVTEARSGDAVVVKARSKSALPASKGSTNEVAISQESQEATNAIPETNEVQTATESGSNTVAAVQTKPLKQGKRSKNDKEIHQLVKLSAEEQDQQLAELQKAMTKSLLGLLAAAVLLGVMIAYDTTSYFAHRSVDMLFDDDHSSGKDPEYEKAEQAWAGGRHMEAIQMMRDYYKAHPREIYVALRIAEIYEKDIRNFLAAALEYEDVLKHKLPAERWGWTAIHLCNLYTKLGREADHTNLLERIATEYPKTAAAKKARSRLGLPEPEIEAAEQPAAQPEPEAKEEAPQPESKSNLPPGFRPK